jgi:AraC-like DNA-binding protein
MHGIDLDKPISYQIAAFRYFAEKEQHIERFSKSNVLLLVFDGVLRFSENGKQYEVRAGEYHIQEINSYQNGELVSDSPKYLYVHFLCTWADTGRILPRRGRFNYVALRPAMEALHRGRYQNFTLAEQTSKFLEILAALYHTENQITLADRVASFLSANYRQNLTLEQIADTFSFSKNHIINTFRQTFGMTPFAYLNRLRIDLAAQLLEVTSQSAESICFECGFHNYAYFYKQFFRVHGMSPRQWRVHKRMDPFTDES